MCKSVCIVVARLVAVAALGAGVGVLTWGITSSVLDEPLRTPAFVPAPLDLLPSEAIGWGAGLLAGGITALLLSVSRSRHDSPP